jgi:hypothetical protein
VAAQLQQEGAQQVLEPVAAVVDPVSVKAALAAKVLNDWMKRVSSGSST